MLHAPNVLKMGGFALAVLALVMASAIAFPMTATAQGPTQTPTARAGGPSAATAEGTQVAEPTRLPPCPVPAGEEARTARATEAATDMATQGATEAATQNNTASATEEATAASTEPPTFEPGYLGIAGEDADSCGTRVVDVIPNSPAEDAGIQIGDIVVGVGVTGYPGVLPLREYIITQPVGAELELVLRRGGEELILPVVLGARPAVIPPTVTASH